MTNSFAHVLGRGGFGTVYKGKLPDSGQDIAVKILMEIEGNGEEFINEVASMSRTSHVNIVPLLEVINNNFGGVSHKSDVYSYGMVVLEMIGARNRDNFVKSGSNNSSMYFPEWIYKDFERGETMRFRGQKVTEEEEKIAKKMLFVGLWCIQTSPSDRPTMIKVIEMLEGSVEALQVPPKPLLYLPPTAVQESVEDSTYETSIVSNPSQSGRDTLSGEDTLRFSRGVVHQNHEVGQHSSRSSKVKANKESGSLT
ncbi:unnamed protein product [Microthlaspi erraticum]|uniref:Protein kinase domain-containing protein n=1 Tax=Microthlaspi erraticum TaxID=1685480 RepID=A0A6D2KTF6_9BRAS|nr:unnamed protein product [Microthlaspi erraticum]